MKPVSQKRVAQRVPAAVCLLALLLSAAGAQAWRAFDALEGARQFSTDYFQAPPSPFMTNFYTNSQPINLVQFDGGRQQPQPPQQPQPQQQQQQQQQQQPQAEQTQILTPVSSQLHQFGAPQQPTSDFQEPQAASVSRQQNLEAQQEFAKQQAAHEQAHQVEVREAPLLQAASTRAPAGLQAEGAPSTAPSPASGESVLSRDISQVTPSEAPRRFSPQPEAASGEVQAKPSPFGKILDSLYQTASAINTTSDNLAAKSQDATTSKPASQLLKAQRPGAARKPTPAATEQQIIDQHARAAAGYNLHSSPAGTSTTPQPQQRLLAVTKNRGDSGNPNRLGAILLNSLGALAGASSGSSSSSSSSSLLSLQDNSASSSSSGPEQPSPIGRFMDNFKSGISSRSSIMKAAISENKLARTLTSVGKTLGGNKYVAGAGIAAALAALGLTVGKYLSPYSLSSGAHQYDKVSNEPLLASGSYTFGNYAPNERQLAQWAIASQGPVLSELVATSSNSVPTSDEFTAGALYGQFNSQQPSLEQAAQMAAAAGLYPGSQHAYAGPHSAGLAPFLSQQAQTSGQFWQAPSMNYRVLRPAVSQKAAPLEQKSSFGTANGHYSSFYNQPEIETATGDNLDQNAAASVLMQSQQAQQQQHSPQQYGSYISGAPASANRQEAAAFSPDSSRPQSSEQTQAAFDQLAAASLESATYQRAPAEQKAAAVQRAPVPSAKRRAGSTGRRSGAVILKLDETSRSRLEQLSASQRNTQAAEWRPYANYFVLGAPTEQQANGAPAQRASLPRSTRAEQRLSAPPPSPPSPPLPSAMTNRQQWSAESAGHSRQQEPGASKLTRFEPASAQQGQFGASGGQSPDSMVSSGASRTQELNWREASQNNENTGPIEAIATKQSVPEYQFVRDQDILGLANEHAKVSPVRAEPQAQTMLDAGWKSIDEPSSTSSSSSNGLPKSQSSDATGRSEHWQQVSRTSERPSVQSAELVASEQLQQLAALIKQQRAREQANANELQTGALRDGHLFGGTPADSIRDKSGQMGGKWNEVVESASKATKTTLAPQHDNHDKTPKSIGSAGGAAQLAAESVDANEAPIEPDNKQSATAARQAAATGDSVVLELVDAGELLGSESSASATLTAAKQKPELATKGEGEPAPSQQLQPTNQSESESESESDNDHHHQQQQQQAQLGKPRAYRGLVAGSIGANAAN